MNDLKEKLLQISSKPKLLIILGILGMLLILLSSFFSGGDKEKTVAEAEQSYNTDTYLAALEDNICEIVSRISGDKKPTVVITLDSSVRYSYADSNETDTENTSGDTTNTNSESKKQSYITVKTSDGGEQALVVTEIMPEIRGVAIVCSGGDNDTVAQKIQNAVTAALNITSKRVYIAGGTDNEKR